MDFFRHALGGDGGEEGEEDAMEEEERRLLPAGANSSSSSEAEEEEEEETSAEPHPDGGSCSQFDVSLPARHLYLGQMEEEGQVAMEDEETTPTLPLLCLADRVLFPGETLPMHIYRAHTIQMLRDAATRHRPVVIVTDLRTNSQLRQLYRPKQEELSKVGTTAEVVGMREEGEEDTQYWGPCLIVKFLGRQRVKLLEIFKRANGEMDGRVVILPEMRLPPRPLHVFACPPCVDAGALASRLVARAGSLSSFTLQQNQRHHQLLQRPLVSATLCQVPAWLFSLYDQDYLRQKIAREEMIMTGDTEGRLPEDTVSLSYWLSRRLPVSDQDKLSLLSIHCPTQRLIQALLIVQGLTDLCCICGKLITKKTHLFSMSVDGPVASYVNPGGHVHDTLTARQAVNVRPHGGPSTQHSWFPGYSWTMLSCRGCGRHKGWLFNSTQRGLDPPQFYGLCRKGLEHKPSSGPESGDLFERQRRQQPCVTS